MQPIEGITPDMLWTFAGVLVGLAALYVLYGKVRETYHRHKQMRGPENRLAEDISRKVLDSLEPRFDEIDRKLSTDKARLDGHDRELSTLSDRHENLEAGQRVICRAMLALLSHEINGNSTEKLREAQQGINDYLIDK